MSPSLKGIRWRRIILSGLLIAVASFAATALVIASYAFSLGMEAHGAPDQQKIQEFASHVGPFWTPIFAIVLTFFGGMRVTRKMKDDAMIHGIILGAFVAMIGIVVGRGFSVRSILLGIVAVAAGWGGAIVSRRKNIREAQPPSSVSSG